MADTGNIPDRVGDLPSFVVTFTPPATHPTAVVSGVVVSACKPDGTIIANDGTVTQVSPNVWSYTATNPIDTHGRWTWRVVTTTGPLVDVCETEIVIPPSRFS